MSDTINRVLKRHAPALYSLLSPLGKRAVFPTGGILAQTAQAKGLDYKATIGQITDGSGAPLPLPSMSEATVGLSQITSFLYSPQPGQAQLRHAWAAVQRERSLGSTASTSLPLVTLGLTQGISLLADLFATPDANIIVPAPFWGNYSLIFGLRVGATLNPFAFFDGDGFSLNGLRQALAVDGPKCVVLNFPGNPTGYTPTEEEAAQIVELICAASGPLVIFIDDAYQGLIWDDRCMKRSIFWDLAERVDPKQVAVFKLDGATKEYFFFPSRVGFITHNQVGEAENAIESKLKALGRATVGSPPGPSQALLLKALQAPTIDAELSENHAIIRARYDELKAALLDAPVLLPYPFNSGMFALVGLPDGVEAEAVRQELIQAHSVGLIAISSENALRIAYGSCDLSDIRTIVNALAQVVQRRLDLL